MYRAYRIWGLLAVLMAALAMAGCRSRPKLTAGVDPAYQRITLKTIAILPIDGMDRYGVTTSHQYEVYRHISQALRQAQPKVTLIEPAEVTARPTLTSDATREIALLREQFRRRETPSSQSLATIQQGLGVDGFLIGHIVAAGYDANKHETQATLEFCLFGRTDGSVRALWSSMCTGRVPDADTHGSAAGGAMLHGVDLVFATLPKAR